MQVAARFIFTHEPGRGSKEINAGPGDGRARKKSEKKRRRSSCLSSGKKAPRLRADLITPVRSLRASLLARRDLPVNLLAAGSSCSKSGTIQRQRRALTSRDGKLFRLRSCLSIVSRSIIALTDFSELIDRTVAPPACWNRAAEK